jgi:hypothetical protein
LSPSSLLFSDAGGLGCRRAGLERCRDAAAPPFTSEADAIGGSTVAQDGSGVGASDASEGVSDAADSGGDVQQ